MGICLSLPIFHHCYQNRVFYGMNDQTDNPLRKNLSTKMKIEFDKKLLHAVTGSVNEDTIELSRVEGSADVEPVKLLVEQGCCPSYADKDGNNVLHEAASRGYHVILKFLVEKFPGKINSKNYYGNTPLTFSIMNKRKDAIDVLLAEGAGSPLFHLVKSDAAPEIYHHVLGTLLRIKGREEFAKIIKKDNEKVIPLIGTIPKDILPLLSAIIFEDLTIDFTDQKNFTNDGMLSGSEVEIFKEKTKSGEPATRFLKVKKNKSK